MAELNLKQINDRLNEIFTGDARKLVFWYDANADFADDIDSLELSNAKIYHLEKNNQFKTKMLFEREDKTTNYLVYAPFAKPDIKENHLADTIRYSQEFCAEKSTLILTELGIDNQFKPVIEKHSRFFGNKQRLQKFKNYDISAYNERTIEIGIMAVLTPDCHTARFEEIAKKVFSNGCSEENSILNDFEKYGLTEAFWSDCFHFFGYSSDKPSLTKLAMTLFATYAKSVVHAELPKSWQDIASIKNGNVIAFLDSMMNDVNFKERFDELSDEVYKKLKAEKMLSEIPTDALIECNLFAGVDKFILKWLKERLLNEDTETKLSGKTIPQICKERRRMHFGEMYRSAYFVIENAYNIIKAGKYSAKGDINEIIRLYTNELYKIDRHYRYFYRFYDA